MASFFKKLYDATSKSSSKVGKFGKYAWPFNSQYLIRDAWRKYGKKYTTVNSAGSLHVSSGVDSPYGVTGSIVGRY